MLICTASPVTGAPHMASQSGKFCAGLPAETQVDTPQESVAVIESKGTHDYSNGSGGDGKQTDSQMLRSPYWTDAQLPATPHRPEVPAAHPPASSGDNRKPPETVETSAPVTPTQPEQDMTEPGSPVCVKKMGSRSPTYWKSLSCSLNICLQVSIESWIYESGLLLPRLRRYFQPKRGVLKCSAEALKLWKDDAGSLLVAIIVWAELE